jgi:hypothetical protein
VQKQQWAACHQVATYDRSHVTLPVLDHKREVSTRQANHLMELEAAKGQTA